MTELINKYQNGYKYRSLSDKDNDYIKNMLSIGELYFPSVERLNDPYESILPLRFDKSDRIFEGRSPSEVYESDSYLELCSIFNKFRSEVSGLFCMSAENDNIVMWSHYADSHKGICVGLDVYSLAKELDSRVDNITYTSNSEFPKIDSTNNIVEELGNLMFVKHKDWEYEKEIRILSTKYINKPYNAKQHIKEVILGSKISKEHEELIIDTVKNHLPKCELYKAKLSTDTYKIDLEKII